MIFRQLTIPLFVALTAQIGIAHGQTWTGSSSPEDLRYRLDVLDAELADIRARLGGQVGSIVQAPSNAGSGGGGAVSNDRLNQLEGEIRRLTAQVERMQNQLVRISDDSTRRFGDIEFRLNELEGNPNDGSVAPVGGGQVSGVTTGTLGEVTVATSVSEQGDLDRAAQDVQQGRFDQAEDRLRRFLNDYQDSPLTGDAWFWLGESQFVRGQHAEAARSYLNGYNFDRLGQQASKNLYKLGVTLGRLGQLNEACLTLREVGAQFPNSAEVGQANAEASQLTCG
ncbi:MAG: tol-pal system protein YbgF [Pseudomonadota bacterium]